MFDEKEIQSEQQFQRAQHGIQILKLKGLQKGQNFGCNTTKQNFRKTVKENVHLKFQKISHNLNNPKNNHKNLYKNISFQSQASYQNKNYNQEYHQYDDGRSGLGYFYQNHPHAQLVYQKSRNIGTQWLSQQQYYTSLFVNPQFIKNSKKRSLFGKFSDLQEHHISLDFPLQITNKNIGSTHMIFDSDFQSGNLFSAYKVGAFQYDLLLQNDINTKGNTQWFYFRIRNVPANKNIKINIVNFRKSDSLFNYGMLPCYHSLQNLKKNNQGWMRKGSKVKYFRNNHPIQNSRKYYYTLTFFLSTEFPNDTLKLAQCYPYTVTDLNNYLNQIQKINYKKEICSKVTIMNKTLGGNKIQALIIKEQSTKNKNNENRPLIIVIARQHPGQTPGSFMVEGLIDYFLSKQKDAQYLRRVYDIRIIPMVNPDGVQAGNYRTNLYGVDLNRKWDCVAKQREPNKPEKQNKTYNLQANQIIHIKRYIASIAKGRQIAFIIDFHGHSRKLNSFFYGNTLPQSPSEAKMFPFICSKLTSMIKYEDCTFNVQQEKRCTARIQFLINYKASNIYTFQASFFGYLSKHKQKKHFTIDNYKNLGMVIGKAIYLCQRRKQDNQIQTKEKLLYQKWCKQLTTNNKLIKNGQQRDSGSQSCPQECQIQEIQRKFLEQQFNCQNQQTKRLSSTSSKVTRQKNRLQNTNITKQTLKHSRQMQVLDIARVNSVFPNDVLALVPNNFYLKSDKQKKQTKQTQSQTQPCPIIRIYESCKVAQQSQIQTQINQLPIEVKSTIFQRTKAKSTGEVIQNSPSIQRQQTLFQKTMKNFSVLSAKSTIRQKQLYQNARHLNALKKSTDIRRHFKKIFTQQQLSKPKSELLKNESLIPGRKMHRHAQTLISFCKQLIKKHNQLVLQDQNIFKSNNSYKSTNKNQMEEKIYQSNIFDSPEKNEVLKEQQGKFWTIESRRKSLGIETRQFNTPITRNQFRKTLISSNMIRNRSNNVYQVDKIKLANKKEELDMMKKSRLAKIGTSENGDLVILLINKQFLE